MWQVYPRRRRVRWLAIGFTIILLVWCFILYKSLVINYDQEIPRRAAQRSSTSAAISPFLYEIDNLDLFLQRTPVNSNYHIFYYPW